MANATVRSRGGKTANWNDRERCPQRKGDITNGGERPGCPERQAGKFRDTSNDARNPADDIEHEEVLKQLRQHIPGCSEHIKPQAPRLIGELQMVVRRAETRLTGRRSPGPHLSIITPPMTSATSLTLATPACQIESSAWAWRAMKKQISVCATFVMVTPSNRIPAATQTARGMRLSLRSIQKTT
jgi:hypothetical protein